MTAGDLTSGVVYDYLRLELDETQPAPPRVEEAAKPVDNEEKSKAASPGKTSNEPKESKED